MMFSYTFVSTFGLMDANTRMRLTRVVVMDSFVVNSLMEVDSLVVVNSFMDSFVSFQHNIFKLNINAHASFWLDENGLLRVDDSDVLNRVMVRMRMNDRMVLYGESIITIKVVLIPVSLERSGRKGCTKKAN